MTKPKYFCPKDFWTCNANRGCVETLYFSKIKDCRYQPKEQMMNDDEIEKKIVELKATAPRVTKDDLEANIADVEIVKLISKTGKVLRWAVLTTQNGFAVTGKPSAAVSVENDREELGKQLAVDNAKNELWALMGYALAEQIHANGGTA